MAGKQAAFGSTQSNGGAGLRQAGIDDQVVAGDAARIVGCEEQHSARDVVPDQPELEALLVEELALELGRNP